MTGSSFDTAFALVVGVEGGYSDDPRDKGNYTPKGELRGTKYGISAASYPDQDIANLTLDQAKDIYRRDYWAKVQGDALPAPVALVLFDGSVNSGVSTAVHWAQAAAGVAVDGVFGPLTLAALQRASAKALVAEIMARRIVYLAALPTWSTYGLGWARRVQAIEGAALDMIAPAPAPAPAIDIEPIKAALRAVLAEQKAAA